MKKSKNGLVFTAALIIAVIQVFPLITMALNSLRSGSEIAGSMIGIPSKLHFENFALTWVKGDYAISYRNNFIIGLFTIMIAITVISLAAYGVTKLNIYFKGFFTAYFIASMAIPAFGTLVPLYFLFLKLGLINSHVGVIFIYSAASIPFNFLLMRAFLIGIPKELEEAARIDGCSELMTLRYVTMPLAKPIIATIALIVFLNTWNEFLFSNTFLQRNEMRTVALRFYNFTGKYSSEYEKIFAAGCITTVPIIFVYLLLQKSFIEGLTQGGVKA